MAPKASVEKTATRPGIAGRTTHRGQQDGDTDEDTAHGGRARFLKWTEAVLANVLANLELAQLLNHVRPDEQGNHQRRQRGEGRAKSQVAKIRKG